MASTKPTSDRNRSRAFTSWSRGKARDSRMGREAVLWLAPTMTITETYRAAPATPAKTVVQTKVKITAAKPAIPRKAAFLPPQPERPRAQSSIT
jgi:hypothetical protein